MKLVVVSGRSGSGKTSALHVLEDLGFYCVDNLPVALLPELTRTFALNPENTIDQVAVGIDARNVPEDLLQFSDVISAVRQQQIAVEVIYLDASDEVLIKRFHSTRRKHPLSNASRPLQEAIASERKLLDTVASQASLRLDTSEFNIHELRDEFRRRIARHQTGMLALLFESFAFKHGVPADADFVYDARCLPNPHWHPELRPLTGLDVGVAEYLQSHAVVQQYIQSISDFLENWLPLFSDADRSYLTVAIGCTGGQHRSVYIAERLAAHFRNKMSTMVQLRHRELPRAQEDAS